MNHDYAHCLDFKDDCPEGCFRAQLVRDLKRYGAGEPWKMGFPISWMHMAGSEHCLKKGGHDEGDNRTA